LREFSVYIIGAQIEHSERIEPVDFGREGAPHAKRDQRQDLQARQPYESGEESINVKGRRESIAPIWGEWSISYYDKLFYLVI
jgi:hypothetical protein